MYTLLSGFWRLWFTKVQYQVLILGLDEAGKTTVLEQLRHTYGGTASPDQLKIPPTVGLNIGKLDVGRNKIIFWDLGGQSGLRSLWDKYYSEAHAVIYVVDFADAKRMEESHHELEKLVADKELLDAPLLIFANKQDRQDAIDPQQATPFSALSVGNRQFRVQPISALSGDGVEAGISWLLSILPKCKRTQRLGTEKV